MKFYQSLRKILLIWAMVLLAACSSQADLSEPEPTAVIVEATAIPTQTAALPTPTVTLEEPTATPVEQVDQPHNVILIIADDYGVDMAALYNTDSNDLPPTPNIDALFAEGVLFENAWSNPICSPTRATMLTGRYSFRTGVGDPVGPGGAGLSLNEITLPQVISAGSDLDYTHANIGKWHLSSRQNGGNDHPNLSGYDYYSGLLRGGVETYSNWEKIVNGSTETVTNYATTEIVDDAIAWLDTQNQAEKPWFLWLAFNAPHSPFHLPPVELHSFDDLPENGGDPYDYYKAMVEAMDTEIGRLLASIPADVRVNTTIIFIGDNGSPRRMVQSPLTRQQGKGSLYNGGVHVPLIVAGPKVANPGRASDALVNSVDMFATILDLLEIDQSLRADGEDAVTLMPYIKNVAHPAERDWIFTERFGLRNNMDYGKAIRNEQYKLIQFETGTSEFYNLTDDPFEKNNLLQDGGNLTGEQQTELCELHATMSNLLDTGTPSFTLLPPDSCK
ncbi:MAG: sulfatase-like hydrolase/transferase [Chloroflexota bacterium]